LTETEAVAAYLPSRILSWLPAAEGLPAVETRVEAVVLFCDISSFTTIANRLVDQGREGLTTLRMTLDKTFDAWITSIHANQGEVARFIGDAIVAVWRVENADGYDAAIRSATAAANGILRSGHDSHTVAGVDVRGKCGIGVGSLDVVSVTLRDDQRELVVLGDALDLATEACVSGNPGSVELQDGRTSAFPDLAESISNIVEDHVPWHIRDRINAGQAEWLGELRPVSIVFVGLPDARRKEEIQRAVANIVENMDPSPDQFVKVNVDEKGVVLMAAWGAPSAHGDDAALAVVSAIKISGGLNSAGITHSVGIASGRAFCGAIGNLVRRDYTIIGHVANLASRLMSLRDGVLMDTATLDLVDDHFTLDDQKEIHLKGIEDPTLVGHPRPRTSAQEDGDDLIVGRGFEKTQIRELIDGSHRVLVLEGEAGIGKSTLARHASSLAEDEDWLVISGSASSTGERQPYGVWQRALWGTFGVDGVREAVDHLAGDSEWFADRRPLASVFLQEDAEETPLTSQMTGSVRAENTWQVFQHLIGSLLQGRKTLVILEDAQWFDSASWALLESTIDTGLIERFLLNTRPSENGEPAELRRIRQDPATQALIVGQMPRSEIQSLLEARFDVDYIEQDVLDRLVEGGSVNPLFAEQLALALREAGQIEVKGRSLGVGVADFGQSLLLTGTLESILTSRIDQAPQQAQLTLKVASVIGREFALTTLEAVHPVAQHDSVASDAGELEREKLLRLLKAQTDPHYEFWHRLTLDVAYQLLPDSERVALHERTAQWLEKHELSVGPSVLAHHYLAARSWSTAAIYLDRAASEAREAHSNVEAVTELRMLHDLAKDGRAPARPEDLARWLRFEADANMALGRYDTARKRYKEALDLWGSPFSESRIGRVAGVIGSSGSLLRETPPLDDAAEREAAAETALILPFLGQMAYFDQKLLELLYCTVTAIRFAGQSGDPASLARAHGAWAIAASLSGLQGLARRSNQKSLEAASLDGGVYTIAYANLLHGILHYGRANWDEAKEGFERALHNYHILGASADADTTNSAYAFLELFRGNPTAAMNRVQQASSKPNSQVRLWMSSATVLAAIMTDRAVTPEVLAQLHQTMAEPHLEKGDALLGWGVISMVSAYHGDSVKLDSALDEFEARLVGLPATTPYTGFGLYGGVLAGLAVAKEPTTAWSRRRALRLARRSARHLRIVGIQNPVIRPMAALGRSRVARSVRAQSRHQARAERHATRLGAEYVEALAAYESASGRNDPPVDQAEEAVA